MKKSALTILTIIACFGAAYFSSCSQSNISVNGNLAFKSSLSEYNIYTGEAGSLSHRQDYKLYNLATPLFSDYAEKQRLIRLPAGTRLTAVDDGLPVFPDGTIIVKTFYYFRNKADTSLGKKIIETRLLIRHEGKWNAASYIWNSEQTDASLLAAGVEVPVNWINEQGQPQVISYRIPSRIECGMCHRSDKDITPIGPKLRNLNVEIEQNGSRINQLLHLQQQGILTPVDPAAITKLPVWTDAAFSLEQRARAYLEVNCAHCHNDKGFASRSKLRFSFEKSVDDSKIGRHKKAIDVLMSRGAMPLIGTTVVDKQGLQLVQDYLKTLK